MLSLFLTLVTRRLGWYLIVCFFFLNRALSSDNRMVCFRRKSFLKFDTAAGLTRSSSLREIPHYVRKKCIVVVVLGGLNCGFVLFVV